MFKEHGTVSEGLYDQTLESVKKAMLTSCSKYVVKVSIESIYDQSALQRWKQMHRVRHRAS